MSILLTMIPIAFVYASPIIIAALGGLFSERSGVVNIALEGIMMVGAFAGASVTVILEPITPMAGYIGLLAGVAAGMAFSLIHAFASVNLKADQVISGTALNILAGGLTVYLCQIFFNQQRTKAFRVGLVKLSVPGLADIPIIGPLSYSRTSRRPSTRPSFSCSSPGSSSTRRPSACACVPAASIPKRLRRWASTSPRCATRAWRCREPLPASPAAPWCSPRTSSIRWSPSTGRASSPSAVSSSASGIPSAS